MSLTSGAGRACADHFVAGRDDVRLDKVVVLLEPVDQLIATRRSVGAVARDRVVRAEIGSVAVSCTHCDNAGVNARRRDSAIKLVALRGFAVVSRCGDDDDARVVSAAGSETQRIDYVGVLGRGPKTNVDDADVVGRLVSDAPVDRGYDVAA